MEHLSPRHTARTLRIALLVGFALLPVAGVAAAQDPFCICDVTGNC